MFFVFQSICLIYFIAIYFKIQGPDVLQPGGAETRTCPMTRGAANCALVTVLVSTPNGHPWGASCSLLCLLPTLPLSPWKQNKMFLINSRALSLLPLYGVLIRLSSIAIP